MSSINDIQFRMQYNFNQEKDILKNIPPKTDPAIRSLWKRIINPLPFSAHSANKRVIRSAHESLHANITDMTTRLREFKVPSGISVTQSRELLNECLNHQNEYIGNLKEVITALQDRTEDPVLLDQLNQDVLKLDSALKNAPERAIDQIKQTAQSQYKAILADQLRRAVIQFEQECTPHELQNLSPRDLECLKQAKSAAATSTYSVAEFDQLFRVVKDIISQTILPEDKETLLHAAEILRKKGGNELTTAAKAIVTVLHQIETKERTVETIELLHQNMMHIEDPTALVSMLQQPRMNNMSRQAYLAKLIDQASEHQTTSLWRSPQSLVKAKLTPEELAVFDAIKNTDISHDPAKLDEYTTSVLNSLEKAFGGYIPDDIVETMVALHNISSTTLASPTLGRKEIIDGYLTILELAKTDNKGSNMTRFENKSKRILQLNAQSTPLLNLHINRVLAGIERNIKKGPATGNTNELVEQIRQLRAKMTAPAAAPLPSAASP